MAFSDLYRRQVELLVRTIPPVAQEACFALKGGTAINLFIRNMPRLSVDIDLTYLPEFKGSEFKGSKCFIFNEFKGSKSEFKGSKCFIFNQCGY